MEQPLPVWGVCNLGHHVLSRYHIKGTHYSSVADMNHELYYPKWQELKEYADVDWDSLARACRVALRLQDNIIDYTPYFLKENEELQKRERRVGIGTMGLGTLMIQLQLRYGSDEGNKFADTLYKFITYNTYKASMLLAGERGTFPAYNFEKVSQSGFMKRMFGEFPDLRILMKSNGLRNVTTLTQAPTGSTGTYIDQIPMMIEKFGGTTTGIEPYFSFKFWRAGRLGFAEQTCHVADIYMKEHGIDSVDELPEWFVTAMDLEPEDHVKVQATIQKWVDSAISKTANAPNDYTVEQVDKLYLLAYELGLKGITIYRDGSREAQVLSTDKEGAKLEAHIEAEKLEELKRERVTETQGKYADVSLVEEEHETEHHDEITKRPSRLFGFTEKVKVPFGDRMAKVYITINVDEDGNPIEVFITSSEAELESMATAVGRLTTQFLRFGKTRDNLDQVVKHLRKGQSLSSLPAKLASLLEQVVYGKIKLPTPRKPQKKKMVFQKCPDCGEQAYDKANCICTSCGASKCN